MKKTLIAAAAVALSLTAAACHEEGKKVIDFEAMPETAKTFVQTHFADKQVSIVYFDRDVSGSEYELLFTDGANIDFNKKGEWKEVEDRDADGVPTAVIPSAINNYVAQRHSGQYVIQIGKENKEYEVKLNNGIEIVFNKNGDFVRYDD